MLGADLRRHAPARKEFHRGRMRAARKFASN
jgi:hypothetical protein